MTAEFFAAEIIGNENSEKITITPNNASQNVYSVSKLYTVTAIGIMKMQDIIFCRELSLRFRKNRFYSSVGKISFCLSVLKKLLGVVVLRGTLLA